MNLSVTCVPTQSKLNPMSHLFETDKTVDFDKR